MAMVDEGAVAMDTISAPAAESVAAAPPTAGKVDGANAVMEDSYGTNNQVSSSL